MHLRSLGDHDIPPGRMKKTGHAEGCWRPFDLISAEGGGSDMHKLSSYCIFLQALLSITAGIAH